MEYRKITSSDQWVDLWLGKFSTEIAKTKLSDDDKKNSISIVKKFLTKHPGNPRVIPVKLLRKFLTDQKADAIPPLILFYEVIARSEEHLAELALLSKKIKK
jgi:hypothetical protein